MTLKKSSPGDLRPTQFSSFFALVLKNTAECAENATSVDVVGEA
jgi:hypothetical protein